MLGRIAETPQNVCMLADRIEYVRRSDIPVGDELRMQGIQPTEAVIDQQLQLHFRPWPIVSSPVVVDLGQAGCHFFFDRNRNYVVAEALLA